MYSKLSTSTSSNKTQLASDNPTDAPLQLVVSVLAWIVLVCEDKCVFYS